MKYFIFKILLLIVGSISLTVYVALLGYNDRFMILKVLLLATDLLLFIVLIPLFTIIVSRIHFLRHQRDLKFILFLFLSAVSIFIFTLPFIFSDSFVGLRWLFLPAAIIFAIAASLILSKENTLSNVYSYILIVLFIIISPDFSSMALPYIYSPPALTSAFLNTSTDCIKFLVNHPQYKDLRVSDRYGILINDEMFFFLEEPSPFQEELGTMIRFRNEFYSLGVLEFRRIDDFILFYKNTNLIFPKGPGLLYSVKGQNPNKIDNEVINSVKPFEKITGNWYMSRRLARGGSWYDINEVVPKALIDHSLRTDHLDLKENLDIKHGTSVK